MKKIFIITIDETLYQDQKSVYACFVPYDKEHIGDFDINIESVSGLDKDVIFAFGNGMEEYGKIKIEKNFAKLNINNDGYNYMHFNATKDTVNDFFSKQKKSLNISTWNNENGNENEKLACEVIIENFDSDDEKHHSVIILFSITPRKNKKKGTISYE